MPSKLAADLLHFTEAVDRLGTPKAVLDTLDKITWQPCRAHVLGASLLPLDFGTTNSLVLGKTVFLHKSAPKGWWEAARGALCNIAGARRRGGAPRACAIHDLRGDEITGADRR